jgi:hypothetical protein
LGNFGIAVICSKLSLMTEKELKIRTRKFAVDILNFIDNLPNRKSANVIANQLGRCGSSVAANYRAACRIYFKNWHC